MATILSKSIIASADVSANFVSLTYAELSESLGGRPRLILPRVELGFTSPIVGGGVYQISAQIGGGNVTPVSSITVPSGQFSSVLQGRHLAIEPDDIVTITIRGLPADTDVSITTALFDATPIQQEDLDVIIDQISNINIVAVQERIILGPCKGADVTTPPTVIAPTARLKCN